METRKTGFIRYVVQVDIFGKVVVNKKLCLDNAFIDVDVWISLCHRFTGYRHRQQLRERWRMLRQVKDCVTKSA
jgi:hypothetical protein